MAIYNFSPGPAMLPKEVLEQARDELLDWRNSGMSIMEMSHRGSEFLEIVEQAETAIRQLLDVPSNYKVLFLQGGAALQFAMAPLNLLRGRRTADYINTGFWATRAILEAQRFASVNVAASVEAFRYTDIPPQTEWKLDPDAAYVHYTVNETIDGLEFHWIPETGDVPLVVDATSTLLSRPIDVKRFGVIYASAQKNFGPPGLTLVIIRDDLVGLADKNIPTMLDYKTHVDHSSMYNTPPTVACYIAGLVFKWLLARGGLQTIAKINERKARKLYDYIDGSRGCYRNWVVPAARSWMNVPFKLADASLDSEFLKEAGAAGLLYLGGPRSLGGMRASLYNAMPEAGVDALIDHMQFFASRRM